MRKNVYFFLFFVILPSIISAQNVFINEFVASNNSSLYDEGTDNYPDWIELYNATSSSLDVSGYFLTDNQNDSTKWAFPPNTIIDPFGFLIVFADGLNTGLHTNYKLSAGGEEIYLYDADTSLLHFVNYNAQLTDISQGLTADSIWVYYSPTTPGAENNELYEFTDILSKPMITPAAGIYNSTIAVTLTADPEAVIHYTTDGSNPTDASPIYSSPIEVSSTTNIKAIAVQPGKLSSYITMRTYLYDVSHDLDVILLTTENESWNDYLQKIIIDGRVKVDMIDKNGDHVISQYADFKTSGNTASFMPQLNGRVNANKRYGKEYFNYRMYPNKEIDKLRSFNLRNASQDWNDTHLRDAYVSRLISTDLLMDSLSFEGYRPAVVYANGAYQGILNIREDDNSDYYEHNYGFENVQRAQFPIDTDISDLDLNTPEGFQEFKTRVHVRDFMLYWSIISFGASEYPLYWKDTLVGEKLMMSFHDFDMSLHSVSEYLSINAYPYQLITNSVYSDEGKQLFATYLNLVFDTTRTLRILDEMTAELQSEIPAHASFCHDLWSLRSYAEYYEPFKNLEEWYINIEALKEVMRQSPASLRSAMISQYGVTSFIEMTHGVEDSTQGYIRVHDVTQLEQERTGKYCSGLPIRFEAVPKTGYKFSHWEGVMNSTDNKISYTSSTNGTITAVFEPIPITLTEIYINEVQPKNDYTIADEYGEYNDWIELYNAGYEAVDLGGYYLSDSRTNKIKYKIPEGFPDSTTIAPNSFLLFWADSDNEQGVRHTNFKLDTTDQVFLMYPDGLTLADSLTFTNIGSDTSFGRVPNGTEILYLFDTPTPNESNNRSPIANAGVNQTITLPINSVSLDGTSSSDPDGDEISFAWTQISGPSSAIISGTSTATPDLSDMIAGTYVFELTVSDGDLNGANQVSVIVSDIITSISLIVEGEKIKTYPNPVADQLIIECDAMLFNDLLIIDVAGNQLYSQEITNDKLVIDMNNFSAGVYMIKFMGHINTKTKMIVKQ